MKFRSILASAGLSLIMATTLQAQSQPFQASLTPNIAIHSQDTQIDGFALSIWGQNPQTAVALGFVNGSSGNSKGVSLGLANYAENYTGVHLSLVNYASGNFDGWQGAYALNYCGGDFVGFQSSLVNLTGGMKGLQLGLFNYAQRMDAGVQIGVVNIIGNSSGWFNGLPDELAPGMILVNWKF